MNAYKKRSFLDRPMPRSKKLSIYPFIAEVFCKMCEDQYKNDLKNIHNLIKSNKYQSDQGVCAVNCILRMSYNEGQKEFSSQIIKQDEKPVPMLQAPVRVIQNIPKLIKHEFPIPNSDGFAYLHHNVRSENETQLSHAPYIADDFNWRKYKDVDDVYDDIPIERKEVYNVPNDKFVQFVNKVNEHYIKREQPIIKREPGIKELTFKESSSIQAPARFVFIAISKVVPDLGTPASLRNKYIEAISNSTLPFKIDKGIEVNIQNARDNFCQRCCMYNCNIHNEDEIMNGSPKRNIHNIFDKAKQPCGLSCYITKAMQSNPTKQIEWSRDEEMSLKLLLESYPLRFCEIAMMLGSSKTCYDVCKFALNQGANILQPQKSPKKLRHSDLQNVLSPKKDRKTLYSSWANRQLQLNKISDTGVRKVENYIPCNHPGRHCAKAENCTCIENGTSCEKFCQCSINCVNRYPGCLCKSCIKSKSCACAAALRECDPDVCIPCGANKLDQKDSGCKNMPIQLGKGINVKMGRSRVHGWGVFTSENVRKNEFIGEYCGEIISSAEAERRGSIYHLRERSFLFKLNEDLEIDASKMGNIMRFVNHSKRPNCYAEVMLVNGCHRIGVYAKRNINASDELFFDYGKEFVEVLPLKG